MVFKDRPVQRFRTGGIAAWSIRHPIGVIMISLAILVLGGLSLDRLEIDLLPHIIYPEVRVRIIDQGVPATVMEDRITRQLEEQLAITEDAIGVQSTTSEGRSAVSLSFEYGKDIDIALRDASTRLDRAKRFLPNTIDPPIIYKRDPSQIPVAEFVVSSSLQDPVSLRDWVDNVYSKWFLNLPGVASVEVGGGLVRDIQVLPDQQRLSGLGLSVDDVISALKRGNVEASVGRLTMAQQEIIGRTTGRFQSVEEIANLPLRLPNNETVRLSEVAEVIDGHEDERLMVRYNDIPGVKVSIQKQPSANTVEVVDAVEKQLKWLREQQLLPKDVDIQKVSDQSVYVRYSLQNASAAAISGAILAMLVVYLFLGNVRRTLIIGTAIPIAIMVTFIIMGLSGLTLNIMTLGGLALGVGMLVDNTIVMLENITRKQHAHQQDTSHMQEDAIEAAGEVNSAIVASTSTNLAAVLPFLFIGGLTGLLFRELIITISAAIIASMVVALTLVPALAARTRDSSESMVRGMINSFIEKLQTIYVHALGILLKHKIISIVVVLVFIGGFVLSVLNFMSAKEIFLPNFDEGSIRMNVRADPDISLPEMDKTVSMLEAMLHKDKRVEGVFSLVGGHIFGRSEYESANRSTLYVQLVASSKRNVSSDQWIKATRKKIDGLQLAGFKVYMRSQGIRGVRTSQGDDDLSLRIQGPDLKTLEKLANQMVAKLRDVKGLKNLQHSADETKQELAIVIDRERANELGLSVEDIGRSLRIAIEGEVVTEYLDGDRSYDVRVRLPREDATSLQDLEGVLLFPAQDGKPPVYVSDVTNIKLHAAPSEILRDRQQRIVEVSASIATDETTLGEVMQDVNKHLAGFKLPTGYAYYDGGSFQTLKENQKLSMILLGLALFLVFVVMAVQYESLRNPIVIMLSVPLAGIGVAIGMYVTGLTMSMPIKLGMIMLAGIVVNNSIVLVEYIEIMREKGLAIQEAILEAARLRLRPIMMTTLTTVVGMAPLAIKLGEGAEMLQPLAVTIVSGLSFSLLVSLMIVPLTYQSLHLERAESSKPTMLSENVTE